MAEVSKFRKPRKGEEKPPAKPRKKRVPKPSTARQATAQPQNGAKRLAVSKRFKAVRRMRF